MILFTQYLDDQKLLNSVGGTINGESGPESGAGAWYITKLFTFVKTPTNVGYYLATVLLKQQWLAILETSASLDARALDGQADLAETVADAQKRLVAIQCRPGRGALTIRTAGEVLALPRNERSCLLGGRLWALGQALVIAGAGGIGKTRLLLQFFVALISGRPWCGFETHASGLHCMLLQTENSTHRLQDDLGALKRWVGPDWALVESNLLIHTLETEADSLLSLTDPVASDRLESAIRQHNPTVIGIDPLRDFAIGDLNSDRDMAETLREVGRITRAGNPDRALVVLHHALTGRAGATKAFGLERSGFARNSKMLQTWTRGLINVVPGAEDDNELLVLTCGKNSNGPAPRPSLSASAKT